MLLGWLLSTISQEVLGQVTNCSSSFEVWNVLVNLYLQTSMARVLQLKQEMQNIKKGSLSVSEFFLKIKILGDSLRAAGQVVSEYDMVLSVVNGLGHDYDAVVVIVTSQHKSMSFQEAQFLAMMHEQRLQHLNGVSHDLVIGASAQFVANNGGNFEETIATILVVEETIMVEVEEEVKTGGLTTIGWCVNYATSLVMLFFKVIGVLISLFKAIISVTVVRIRIFNNKVFINS